MKNGFQPLCIINTAPAAVVTRPETREVWRIPTYFYTNRASSPSHVGVRCNFPPSCESLKAKMEASFGCLRKMEELRVGI